jgi:YD repeat-containing protein
MPQAGSTRIVFTSNRDGQAQIYSMDTNGGNLIRLTNNTSNDDHPRWSPNGSKILFQSDRDNPQTGTYDVYVMNADGTGQTRLTTDAADDCNAVWSPDGSKIVFQSLRNGTYYQVYKMNADGTSQTNLSNGTAADYQPSWSPNGSKVAFASERDHAGAPSIYVMNVNGSSQTRLTFSSEIVRDEQPEWSRDAAKIAFVSTRDANKEIYVMSASGTNQLRLTNTLENDDSPYWSPDGSQIVFRSERERDSSDPIQQLWLMNADGNNQLILAGNTFGDYSPSWNSNGNQPPVANSGGPYSGVVAQNVPFSGSGSFDPDGSVSSYSWSFGDGGTGSGISLTHTYASAGTYPVMLTVTDNLGAQTTATTTTNISTAASEAYLANFNLSALNRTPYTNESSYWNDILRAAYPNGQSSMLLAVRELGRTLFESSDYAARSRDNHWYVYDLYKTYLMRDPDPSGWGFWEEQCNLYGREQVRRAFDECTEFAGIVATLTPSGAPSSTVSSLASARVDPFNQPGNGLTSRDAEWSVSLLGLRGRAGLDLGLSLSYSSMIWTRSGPYIYFDQDNSWPSPGFRLGFPTVQERYFDAQAGRNVYLLLSGGSRVSLRQLGTSNLYEAADSSYLQLVDNGNSLLVRTTDGTQLSYQVFNSEWRCTQIKDRNGNYLTVNYDWLGHIANVIDTLARTITFNYDTNSNLLSITQSWTVNGSPTTHTWASFGWTIKTIQPSFSGVMVVGANPATIPVINQVGLDDGSHYTFDYNSAGQVNPIRSYRSDNVQRTYTAYDYDSAADDCPRLIDTHTWAENWTGINDVPQEVATIYGAPGDGSHTVTTPDGTLYKEFYGTGFKKGLTTQTEVWSAGVRQKWTVNTWTQDNTGVSYQTNPRVTETNIFDAGGNRRRTTVSYASFVLPSGASCPLPSDTREYAGDASSVLRRSHVDYRMDPTADAAYLSRHIVGLVKEQTLFEVNGGTETLMSKVGKGYDETGSLQGNDAPVRHDNSYDGNFVVGRANLSSVKRYDITDNGQWTVSSMQYNTAGGVVATHDPLNHGTTVSYADSFSDGNNGRNTFAYPKAVTNAEGYSSTVIYNFDFGAVTSKQTPQPNTIQNLPGPVQTFSYDAAGRIERATATTNGAYTRYVYGPNYVQTFATVNTLADEAYSIQLFDGLGRVTTAASNHPGSNGGYSARNAIYDAMGRAVKQSNPTEVTSAWLPTGDDNGGWFYTQQSYDWKGRPRITADPDGTTKEASYSGCGCAGGEVVTLTDEGTIDQGTTKRRQSRVYSDVLGRTVKTELLNWQGGSPYATTINNYNARDQLKSIRQYQGDEASGIYQETTMTYDGYGRLRTKHTPQQDSGTITTWDYNLDDTVQKITDARGSVASYSYNARYLVSGITYNPSAGIADTPDVSFGYDAVGNRMSMMDGLGSKSYNYNQLSQLTSETRTFNGVGAFTLSYDYNFTGELKKLTDSTGMTINYGYDTAGRPSTVTGSDALYAGVSNYASDFQYRAWGGLKSVTDGKGNISSLTYNSKLQPTQFDISGGVVHQNYDYYSDGHMRTVHNTTDQNFDRSYSYDQAGRMTEAKSGADVNGYQYAPTPYHVTFGYDAFSNLTARQSDLWNGTFSDTDSASYTDNRRLGWGYDADGRNTTIDTRTYTFDSVGRQTSMTAQQVLPNGNHVPVTETDGYDADGAMVSDAASGVTTYYLRSSALGGAVVEEIGSNGQKNVGHVYSARGTELAQQSGGSVNWKHNTPAGTSQFTSDSGSSAISRTEFDPLGANVPLTPPSQTPPNEGEGDLNAGRFAALMDSRWSDFGNLSAGCSMAWMSASCSRSMADTNLTGEMQAAFDYQQYDLPGNNNELARGEARYDSIRAGYDPEFNRLAGTVTVTYASGAVATKKNPTLDEYQQLQTAYLADSGYSNLETNTVTVYGGAEYFVSPQNSGEQLSPCLRDALRQFFPQQTAQGNSYSPVDDARFKNWIPGWIRDTTDPAAITMGLYDIHYDPKTVNINGGDIEDLKTVIEEISHTVQFIQVWAGLKQRRIIEPTVDYEAARLHWQNHYFYYAVKGLGYDNDVERWAKQNVTTVLNNLRANAKPNQGELCGFKLY